MGHGDLELTVYSTRWCPDCRTAKRFLDENQIPYREIDIDDNPEAADEVVRHTGKRAIPQFVLNGQWVQPYVPGRGFRYDEMRKLFGIEEGQAVAAE